MKKKIVNILIHTFIWAFFVVLPLIIIPKSYEFLYNETAQLVIYIVLTIISIIFFYFNFYYTIPELYFRKKYVLYILFLIAFFAITVVVTRFIVHIFNHDYNFQNQEMGFFRNYFLRFLIIFIVSLLLAYRKRYKQNETERIKSELSTLKAQINPHFLFNTLNGIYGQAIIKSEKTADSISKLSLMMRYFFTETNAEKVSLSKEINYIESYIELQKIRLTDKTKVIFTVEGEIETKQIAPLLFINFIENAFKYGVSNEVETKINISISVDNGVFVFNIINDKVRTELNSNKFGIKNAKHRLDLLYPNNYSLEIRNNEKSFEVNLKIDKL